MQCRSFEELATNGRFPGACEIRSVYARLYESHDDLGRNGIGHVVTGALSPSLSLLVDMPPVSDFSNQVCRTSWEYIVPSPNYSCQRSQNINGDAERKYRISKYIEYLISAYIPDFFY